MSRNEGSKGHKESKAHEAMKGGKAKKKPKKGVPGSRRKGQPK
jgi:hypothetical protein